MSQCLVLSPSVGAHEASTHMEMAIPSNQIKV